MPHKKGNISILVIFVLLASSLLGVLAMHFVQNILRETADTMSYYRSYYAARAGLELGLAQAADRGIGFSYIHTGSIGTLSVDYTVDGRGAYLSAGSDTYASCTGTNIHTINAGDALLVPLFVDQDPASISASFMSGVSYTNLFSPSLRLFVDVVDSDLPAYVILGLITATEEGDTQLTISKRYNDEEINTQLINTFLGYVFRTESTNNLEINQRTRPGVKNYLFIGNDVPEEDLQLCIRGQDVLLPRKKVIVTSHGAYQDSTIGLQAVYDVSLPTFLLNTYVGY